MPTQLTANGKLDYATDKAVDEMQRFFDGFIGRQRLALEKCRQDTLDRMRRNNPTADDLTEQIVIALKENLSQYCMMDIVAAQVNRVVRGLNIPRLEGQGNEKG